MSEYSRIAVLFFLILGYLAGCGVAPMNKNFPLIEKGMSVAEVQELIGKPISAESGPDETKIYYYRLASSLLDTDGSDTREYYVVMDSGEVIGYGERTDAATIERQARQFKAAWNASRSVSQASANIANANQAASSQAESPQTTKKTHDLTYYQLASRNYNPGLGMTICTYRDINGSQHKVTESIGDAYCPGSLVE